MPEEINTEKLLSEAQGLCNKFSKPMDPKKLTLDQIISGITSSYEEHKLTKDLVDQVRNHVATHILVTEHVVGADVRFKFITDKHGKVKRITHKVYGHPMTDPQLPYMLDKAATTGRKLNAVVNKVHNAIEYTWLGGSDNLVDDPRPKSDYGNYSGGYLRKAFKVDEKKRQEAKPLSRFAKVAHGLRWVISLCPIEVKWKARPEPIHPLTGLPLSQHEELVDFWQVSAGVVDEKAMLANREVRRKARIKWYQFWKR